MNSTFVANLLHGSLRICVAAAVALSFFSNTLFAETYTYKGAQIEYTGAQVSEVDGDLLLVYKDTSAPHSLILPGYALARILVVGGGGAGGDYDNSSTAGAGGGGGAGGFVEQNGLLLTKGNYEIVVGAGGAVRTSGTYAAGASGGNSWVTNETTMAAVLPAAIGGGGGGFKSIGRTGGSGGGSSRNNRTNYAKSSGVDLQGNAGGAAKAGSIGGGGGGAGGPGADAVTTGAAGGIAKSSDITGSQIWYAGGGGGGVKNANGAFGLGGGTSVLAEKGGAGDGGGTGSTHSLSAFANTGGGGGGAGGAAKGYGGAGGSGIVVIRISWASESDKIEKPAAGQSFVYDGSEQFVAVEVPGVVTLSGRKTAINVGEYQTTATLASGMKWADDSDGPVTVNWSITRKPVPVPTAKAGLVYDGSSQSAETTENPFLTDAYEFIDNPDGTPSVTSATDAGTYKFTVRPNSNHKWADDSTGDKTVEWSIARKPVPIPTTKTGLIYNGSNQIAETNENPFVHAAYDFVDNPGSTPEAPSPSVTNAVNAGEYNFTVCLDSNHCWEGGDISDKTIAWNIAKAPVALPPENAFINEFDYTGLPLTAMTAPDGAMYYLDGDTTKIDVGVYTFDVKLKDPANYRWESTSYTFHKTWSIKQASNLISNFAIEGWEFGLEENIPSGESKFGTIGYKWSSNKDAVDSERFAFGAQKIDKPGIYYLWATVEGNDNYDGAEEQISFVVWDKVENTFTDFVDITISNKTQNAKSNYPVLISISESAEGGASGEKSGFEYARAQGPYEFAFTYNGALISYTNEVWNTSNKSQFWVLLPSLAAGDVATVRMWWHRPDASKPVPVVHHEKVFEVTKKVDAQSAVSNYLTEMLLVNKEGVWQNYWLEHPAISRTTWDEGESGAESFITGGALATGSVKRAYLVLPRLQETNEFPTTRGSYVVEFSQGELDGVALIGEKRRLDFAIIGHSPNPDLSDDAIDSNGRTNYTVTGRILLMNNDYTHGGTRQYPFVDYQAYRDADTYGFKKTDVPSFWSLDSTDAATVSTFQNLKKEIYSTLYTKDYGRVLWQLKNCRHGNLYPKSGTGTTGLDSNQNYLPWSTTSLAFDNSALHTSRAAVAARNSTSHVVMRNTLDACVYSGCFKDGVGTIYFDAVNAFKTGYNGLTEEDFKIVVEYATETIDGKEPTDENCKSDEAYDNGTYDYTKKLEGKWIRVADVVPMIKENSDKFSTLTPTNEVALNIQSGGTYDNFYRIRATLNIRKPIRIRIRRTGVKTGQGVLDDSNFILLDNIIVSPPAQFAELVSRGSYDNTKIGKNTLGYEGAFTRPFPAFTDNESVFGRAKVVWQSEPKGADGVISAKMHYRWRYLDQLLGPWQEVYLDPEDNFKSIEPLKFEKGAEGDIEYYFTGKMQASYYQYSDYSGCGVEDPLGGWTEELTDIYSCNKPSATLASGGTNWFVRLRNGQSDRAFVEVDVVGHDGAESLTERYPMELIDDYMWRALIPVSTNIKGKCSFKFVGRNLQVPGAEEFEENAVNWGITQSGVTNSLPSSGKLVEDGERVTFELDHAAGFVEFKMSEKFMTFSLSRAEYQPFNEWHDIAPSAQNKKFFLSGIHTNSSNIVEMRKDSLDMSSWKSFLRDDPNWQEGFLKEGYDDTVYKYDILYPVCDTPQGWTGKQITLVRQSLADIKTVGSDYKEMGMAGKLLGQGRGTLDYTGQSITPPDGLDTISFKARIGQTITHESVAYDALSVINENYTFFTPVTMSQSCSTNGTQLGDMAVGAAVSVFAYYFPYQGAYEFRVERRHKGTSYIMSLRKWKSEKGIMVYDTLSVATNTVSYAWSDIEEGEDELARRKKYFGLFISCQNQDDGSVKIVGGISQNIATPELNTPASPFFADDGSIKYNGISYLDKSSPWTYGATGIASQDCPAQFLLPVRFNDNLYPTNGVDSVMDMNTGAFANKALAFAQASDETMFESCGSKIANGRQWAVPKKRMESYYNSAMGASYYGLRTPTNLAQKAIVQLRRHGSSSESDWETIVEKEISNYALLGGDDAPIYVRRSGQWDVRFTTGEDAVDIVYDDLKLTRWSVEDYEGISTGDKGFVYTESMVEGEGSSRRLIFNPARAEQAKPISLRSPLLNGLGKIAFTVSNVTDQAEIWVQMATNSVVGNLTGGNGYNYSIKEAAEGKGAAFGEWITLKKFSASSTDPETKLRENEPHSVYVGLHDNKSNPVKGVFRLFVPTNKVDEAYAVATTAPAYKDNYGQVEIISCTVWDEPGFCERSWRGWNLRGVGDTTDSEKRMYLADFRTEEGSGISAALNNSLRDLDIKEDDKDRAVNNYPSIVSPTFGEVDGEFAGIGTVTYKARLYSTSTEIDPQNLPGRIVIYGSTDSTSERWTAVFTNYIHSQVFTNVSWSAGDAKYRAVKFEITNPSGDKVSDNAEVARVILDEVVVSEKKNPAVNIKYARPFRMNLLNSEIIKDILSPNEQPIAGESWGIQTQLTLEQLADEIDVERGFEVTFSYFSGTNTWGYARWQDKAEAHKLACVDESNYVYRSVMEVPRSLVAPSPKGGSAVQFMVNVKYWDRGGNVFTARLNPSNWEQPEWYYPVDYNEKNGGYLEDGKYFSPYTIIDTVSPGRAWINEVNWNDGKAADKYNQFIEIAVPSGVNMADWQIRFTDRNKKTSKAYVFNNFNAASKISSTATNGYSFYVIQSPQTEQKGKFKLVDGSRADGTWIKDGVPDKPTEGTLLHYCPYQFELFRPSGVLEHQIVVQGTNEYQNTAISQYWSGEYLYDELSLLDDSTRRLYAGEDLDKLPGTDDLSSIGVIGGNKDGDPPPGGSNTWSNAMRHTPGAPNEGQIIPEGWFLRPNGTNIWIYASVIGDNISQNLGGDTARSLLAVIPSSASTSIVYTVARYHEVAAITVNGVTNVAHASPQMIDGKLQYTYDIVKPTDTMYINAYAGYDSKLSTKWNLDLNDRYTPSIVNWLTKNWPDKSLDDVKLATFQCTSSSAATIHDLTLKQMYWFDIDPFYGGDDGKNYRRLRAGVTYGPEIVPFSLPSGLELKNHRIRVKMYIEDLYTGTSNRVERMCGLNDARSDDPSTYPIGWRSASIKINGSLQLDGKNAWLPVRTFVVDTNSFYNDTHSDYPFESVIDIIDPFSTMSPGYSYGWTKYPGTTMFYKLSVNDKSQPVTTELLKPDSTFK